jgi:hypothetical protein
MLFAGVDRNAAAIDSEAGLKMPVQPGCAALRRALRANIVCFPSRIPILLRQPPADMQWRMVLLFFVRGWSSAAIGARFRVPKHRIQKILNRWSFRALAFGHVQIIDPVAFAASCHVDVEYGTGQDSREVRIGEFRAAFPDADLTRGAQIPPVLGGTLPEGRPVEPVREGAELVGALELAIARCEERRGGFWMHLATALRDMRMAAAAALEVRRPGEPADEMWAAFPIRESDLSHGLHVRDEERAYHAVV